MSAIPRTRLMREQYLVIERNSDMKHEFYDTKVFAMAGAKRNHNKIAVNIGPSLGCF